MADWCHCDPYTLILCCWTANKRKHLPPVFMSESGPKFGLKKRPLGALLPLSISILSLVALADTSCYSKETTSMTKHSKKSSTSNQNLQVVFQN